MKRSLLFLAIALVVSVGIGAATKAEVAAKSGDSGVGQTVKDSWITSKAKMLLLKDKRVKSRHIHVETQGGVVALRGKVASAAERAAAGQIASKISGVKGVSNVLQVVPESQRERVDVHDAYIEKTLKERLGADKRLKEADIDVRSDNGMVTLMGTVPSVQAKTHAADLVRKVPGVRSVRNELRQKSSKPGAVISRRQPPPSPSASSRTSSP